MKYLKKNLMKTGLALLVSVVCALPGTAFSQQKAPEGAKKVLLLPGGQRNHHAYRRQAHLLQKLLEDTKRFEVTLCEDAALLETSALARYDLVVATADRRDAEFKLTEPQQRGLLTFVQNGKGLYSLHGFCCADKTWVPEMRQMLGGVLAHFGTPDTKVKMGSFLLKIADSAHPIAAGVSDFMHDDELYYYLQTTDPLKSVAVALYEGKEWPVIWTRNFGKGRVCVNSFGHLGLNSGAKDPLEDAPFQRLVLQGIAWVADTALQKASH